MDKFIKRKQSDDNESESKRSKAAKPCDKAPKARPKRQYCDDYLKYGFHWTGSEDQPFPLCVICGEKMSNEGMVPSKLSRHFVTKHSQLQDKNLNYFRRLLEQQSKQKTAFQKLLTVFEKAQAAFYDVAEMIAQQTRSHTLAESIILPACRKIVKRILGDKAEQEIRKTPLSNNTIQRRIVDLSANIEETVQTKLQSTVEFALQVDESTDISGKPQLLASIRFVDGNQIINQFLCCKEMLLTTRGQDVFDILSAYLEKWNLSWNSCIGICTDGAPCMVGSIVSLVQKENPNVVQTHCFLHREVLVSKTIPDDLSQVFKQVVEMVDFIKMRPKKSRFFEKICVDMDSRHKRLILHTEARWLSRGKVLWRVHELHKELHAFFKTEEHEHFCEYLECEFWLSRLEYLAEIFAHLNGLNTSMQGREENILTSSDKLIAFEKKVAIWKNRAEDGNLEMFPLVRQSCIKKTSQIVFQHLTTLEEKIYFYLPPLKTDEYDWVRNPSIENSSSTGLLLCEEEELACVSSDRGLKIKHAGVPIDTFWIAVKEEYPSLAKNALTILVQFSTSYLCELGFSILHNMKSKKRERLSCIEEEMRVCLSEIRPDIEMVAKKHQAQVSH